MSELVLFCARREPGLRQLPEQRLQFTYAAGFREGHPYMLNASLLLLDGTAMDISSEYHPRSGLFGLWLRQNGTIKFSVQGIKSTSRFDDPVIVYGAPDNNIYDFCIGFADSRQTTHGS